MTYKQSKNPNPMWCSILLGREKRRNSMLGMQALRQGHV